MIYDARILTKRFFSFGDQNDASLGLKILGFLIAIGGDVYKRQVQQEQCMEYMI